VATGGANGIAGRLSLCSNRTTYGVGERVCFVEWIKDTAGNGAKYGVLGVHAARDGGGALFQTSWSAQLAPGEQLTLGPGCEGPVDVCGGAWEDGMSFPSPGTYRLTLSMCFSPFSVCGGSEAVWAALTSPIVITVQ
jgi:hypothetical protein